MSPTLRIVRYLGMFQQCRWYYKPNDGVLPRRDSRRTLAKTRREVSKPQSHGTKDVLIPPFVSPGELRILLGIDYKSALSLCNVRMYQQKYYWSDSEGRTFETSNKRKVLVPFDLIAPSIRLFGLNPVLVDPEPVVPVTAEAGRIPAVAVLGFNVEYGVTILSGEGRTQGRDSEYDLSRITLLGIPSDSFSMTLLGRTVSNADLTLIASDQFPETEAVKSLLRAQGRHAVEINGGLSSVEELKGVILSHLKSQTTLRPATQQRLVCAAAEEYEREAKRTDVLVDAHKGPSAAGIVLDVVKTAQEGTTALVLIFRGKLKLGLNFVAGSGFGKITNILSIHNESLTEAIPGMVVKVGRLVKSEEYTGDFAPDDFFHVLPRERAWRIAFHRQRIEWLSSFQTGGSKLTSGVSFELPDAVEMKKISKGEENREGIKHLLKDAERNHSILVEPVEEDDQDEPPIRKRAERESEKVRTRWQRREEARIALKQKQIDSAELERQELHKMRQLLYTGEIISSDEKVSPPPKQSVPKPPAASLPQKAPVVPVIVKTASVSEFDLVLDELESLEQQFNVKIPVVHGGIGPVTPNDVVHAEIESKFSPCPIYMVNTSALPQSVSKEVQLVTVENVSHLVSNVRQRIKAVIAIESRNSYNTQLGMRRKLRA